MTTFHQPPGGWIVDPNITFHHRPGDMGACERIQVTVDAEGRPVYGHRWRLIPRWAYDAQRHRWIEVDRGAVQGPAGGASAAALGPRR